MEPEGDEEDGLLWDETEYRLSELTDKFVLPQVVKVVCGYDEGDDGVALGWGQVMTIHNRRTLRTVAAKDSRGRDVYIPATCKQKVELRPSEWLDEVFTVNQLSQIFPRYKCARVTQGIYTPEKQRAINIGDKLQLKEINHTGDVLICENQDKVRLCLPMNLEAGFHPLCDSGEYFIEDIIGWFQLPVYVQFTDQELKGIENSKWYNPFLGVLRLDTVITNEEVVCSSKYDGKRFMLTIPKDLSVTVVVADDNCEQNKDYVGQSRSLDDEAHIAKLKQLELENIYASPQAIREFKGLEFDAEIENVEEIPPPAVPPRNPNCPSRNRKKRKEKKKARATPVGSKDKTQTLPAKSEKSMGGCKDTYESIADLALGGRDATEAGSKNCGGSGYDYITLSDKERAKPKLVESKREKEDENTELYETIPERDFQPQSPVYGGNSIIIQPPHPQTNDSKKAQPTSKSPPTTPKASPISTPTSFKLLPTAQAPTSHTTSDLSDLTISEVSNFLREHRLGDLVEIFEQEQIDGSMLLILDQEMMKALGMNAFQAKKLLMLIEGWRPKT